MTSRADDAAELIVVLEQQKIITALYDEFCEAAKTYRDAIERVPGAQTIDDLLDDLTAAEQIELSAALKVIDRPLPRI